MGTVVTPYKDSQDSKKDQVAEMFDNIAFRYDLLNQILSLGIHKSWRKKTVSLLEGRTNMEILDVATGTGDLAIECLNADVKKIIGVDISEGMLKIGKEKIKQLKLEDKIELQYGDAEKLVFPPNTFDAVTVSFGVRNFENLRRGLENMKCVLKPGGRVIILEFSKPKGPFGFIFQIYFKFITPAIGRIFSKDIRAYTYLPESVNAFPAGEDFIKILKEIGFNKTVHIPLTFGIASIYTGIK